MTPPSWTYHLLSPRLTNMPIYPCPSLIPYPAGCLGPQLISSPCPHPPRPLPSSEMSVCTPPPSHPQWANPASPGSPDIPVSPTPLAQGVGYPQKEPGAKAMGSEMERMEYPIFLH
ncbi:Hypothetical predicted protein [Marmota monax]|uniref:Uncharacterized protein n=1 Tax=Marmota monax TaxID=9995 RepID=A0A5E4AJ14_MARMO|nr:Hypothetical predicted protein [Marmota monax]